MRRSVVIFLCCLCIVIFPSLKCQAASPPSVCPSQLQPLFIYALRSQCSPLYYSPNPILEVSGYSFERLLDSQRETAYTAVLFYASTCPFSYETRMTFGVLSSMYPLIKHLAVEQSAAMPSLFSRYGIHSLPAIIMVNQTSKIRYRGPRDLVSLLNFYKKTTGNEPVQYIAADQIPSLKSDGNFIMQSWIGLSTRQISEREPYLMLSVLFLLLRMFLYVFPRFLCRVQAIWTSYRLQLNLEIFGETSQILGRILHMIDVKRVWTRLKLSKNRNLHQHAESGWVWLSSLASVSLSKISSSRSSSS